PPVRGHLLPLLVAEAPLVVHHLANVGHGTCLGEEVAGRLAQHLLLFAEAEVHRRPFSAVGEPGHAAGHGHTIADVHVGLAFQKYLLKPPLSWMRRNTSSWGLSISTRTGPQSVS